MTVITNIVVALMIVTQGEEPVRAYPEIEVKRPESPYCVPVGNHVSDSIFNSIVLVRPSDNVETLYRKTCKTNFVYSADVNISPVKGSCEMPGCDGVHQYTIDELFKCPIRGIYFETSIRYLCEKHKYLQYLWEVGK